MNDTQNKTDLQFVVAPPVTRAALAQALATGIMLPVPEVERPDEARPAPQLETWPEINMKALAYITAGALRWAVEQVYIRRQVGRFVLVDYTARQSRLDPDVMVAYDTDAAAQTFNALVGAFQDERRFMRSDWEDWRLRCQEAARKLLAPLHLMQPSPNEANFVMEWLLGVIGYGKVAADGIFRYQSNGGGW